MAMLTAIRTGVREEIAAREALAREAFAGLDFTSHRNAPFLWMKLPEPWSSGTFKRVAADEGVLIDDEDEYKPGRSDHSQHRIRVGFSQPAHARGRCQRLRHHPPADGPRQHGLRQLRLSAGLSPRYSADAGHRSLFPLHEGGPVPWRESEGRPLPNSTMSP